MRTLLWLLAFTVCSISVQAREAYKYVDPEHGVEFSDTPRPGAEKIDIRDPLTVPAPARTPTIPPSPKPGSSGVAVPYTEIVVAEPQNGETIRDNTGNLIVSVHLEPGLQTAQGHRLLLLLDGSPVGDPGTSANFALSDLNRGTHTLQAQVVGADSARIATSATSTFYLHQASIKRATSP